MEHRLPPEEPLPTDPHERRKIAIALSAIALLCIVMLLVSAHEYLPRMGFTRREAMIITYSVLGGVVGMELVFIYLIDSGKIKL